MYNTGADQTARMRRLIYAFVVRIGIKQFFSWCGSIIHIAMQNTKAQISLRIRVYNIFLYNIVYNILQTVTYVTHNFWNLRIIFVTFFCMKNVFCD